MGKAIIWTQQPDAELNEAFLDLLEKSESLETTTRIISEIYESAAMLALIQRFISWTRSRKTT